MMPDLGKYAAEVMSAYAVSIGLIVGLVWITLRRSAKMRAQLEAVEDRKKAKQNG